MDNSLKKNSPTAGKIPFILAGLVSLAYGGYRLSAGDPFIYFFGLALALLMATGLIIFLENRYLARTSGYLKKIQNLRCEQSLKKTKTGFVACPTDTLQKGDIIQVKTGGKIPMDGVIVSGTTSVDETVFTGEPKILLKGKGDPVIGGSINRDGDITIELTADRDSNVLEKIIQTHEKLFPVTLKLSAKTKAMCAGLSYLGILLGSINFYLNHFISLSPLEYTVKTTLAILLAFSALSFFTITVMAIHIFIHHLIQKGILMTKWETLDNIVRLNTLFFDKTGTLTRGDYEYSQTFLEKGTNQGKLLSSFFSLESHSSHFLFKAMETHPWFNEIQRYEVKNFEVHPGLGVCGMVYPKGQREYFTAVGNLRFLKRMQMYVTREMKAQIDDVEDLGDTVVLCGYDRQVKGMMSFSDILRPHVKEMLQGIQKLHVEPAIITSDSEEVLSELIQQLNLKKIFSRCTPEEKVSKIGKEKNQGKTIGLVSDSDDMKALEKADVSVCIDTGTAITNKMADVLVMGSDIRLVSWLIQRTKSLYRTVYLCAGVFALNSLALTALSFKNILEPEMVGLTSVAVNVAILNAVYFTKKKNLVTRHHQSVLNGNHSNTYPSETLPGPA